MLMRERGRWGGASGALLPVVLPSALISLIVIVRHPVTIYTSDSVAQQSVLRTWMDVGHGTAYLPPDTWLLKVPLYWAVEILPGTPHDHLLLDALALNVLTFATLGWATWALARLMPEPPKVWPVALAMVWLAALGGGIGSNRMLLNARNVELGLAFVILAFAAKHLAGEGPRTRRGRVAAGVVAVVLLAALWLDDPYIGLLVAAPLAVACVLWWLVRDRRRAYLEVAALAVVSLLLLPVAKALAGAAGITVVSDPGVSLDPSEVVRRLGLIPAAVAVQLGIDHVGGPVGGLTRFSVAAVMLAGLLAGGALAGYGWRRRSFMAVFIGLHLVLVVAGFLASGYVADTRSGRYLVLGAYDVVVALALVWPVLTRRLRRAPPVMPVLAAVVAVSAVCGTVTVVAASGDEPPAEVAAQQRLLSAVRASGATKGVAPFWTANVVDYFSSGGREVDTAPVGCRGHRLGYFDWLTDTARTTPPATRTFLVWEPNAIYLRGCTPDDVAAQFGPPARIVPVDADHDVMVWDTDITARIR